MNPGRFACAALAFAASSLGCAGAVRDAAAPDAKVAATCGSLDALEDLRAAIDEPARFGDSSDLSYLVAGPDDELGYVRVARASIAAAPAARDLDGKLGALERVLEARRGSLAQSIGALEGTYEAAEVALDHAATCNGVDLRAHGRPSYGVEARAKDEERAKKLDLKACRAAVRLWSAAGDVDVTSEVSASSIASHVVEIAFARGEEDTAKKRDDLARALRDHASALKRFHAAASPRATEADASEVRARRCAIRRVRLARGARRRLRRRDAGVGARRRRPREPRRVTVTVRPKWTGTLAALPHPEAFGSGFIVRWRSAAGAVETRVVTNNHVMAGAFEADIVAGDRDKDHGRGRAPCNRAPAGCRDGDAWHATLVQANPHDDVAILKLDGDAASAFSEGIAFRLTPAREEEQVVAAGFPGVGVEPSFQVSRGSVSNAAFGADPSSDGAMRALVQHTAPIEPGNSGGPLLDADGQLLGMNTFKIVGRDNVGLAIPTPRIQEALLRSERHVAFDAKNAEGSCNAAVAALASPHPAGEAMSRFGLSVFAWTEAQPRRDERVDYKDEVRGQPSTPFDLARLTAYAAVRAAVERERGVRPYEVCSDLKPGAERGTFVATFHTRAGKRHALVLGEEHGAVRVESFE